HRAVLRRAVAVGRGLRLRVRACARNRGDRVLAKPRRGVIHMRQWLDRVTGVVTMYVMVLGLLVALAAIALVLSIAGQLSYGPLALILSAVVAVGLTVATSWLAAKVMRVEPHLASAVITGLLVFFIMQPSAELVGLSGIAIAAVAASVSKYLLAWRRRHVFNPAALGAFVPTMIVFITLDVSGEFLSL